MELVVSQARSVRTRGGASPALLVAMAAVTACPAAAWGQGCSSSAIFGAPETIGLGSAVVGIAVGDVNGDERSDVIAALPNESAVVVLLNAGDGTLDEADRVFTALGLPRYPVLVDTDQDGDLDVVVILPLDDRVQVLVNNGFGRLTLGAESAVGDIPTVLDAVDLTGDGLPDIVSSNSGSGDITILPGLPGGGFGVPTTLTGAPGVYTTDAADLDGDGDLDLVAGCIAPGQVLVYEALGTGAFAPPRVVSAGSDPQFVRAADLDGDGVPEILATNPSQSSLAILDNLGGLSFAARAPIAVGAGPFELQVDDINGDGILDVVVGCFTGKVLTVLRGDGAGGLTDRIDIPLGNSVANAALADVNGDGGLDAVTGNQLGDGISVLANRCVVAPRIVRQPEPVLLDFGGLDNAEFVVEAIASMGLAYQWRLDGVDLVDGGGISGAMADRLSINPGLGLDGVIDVVVSIPTGSVTSEPAVLAIRSNPCPADVNGDGVLDLFDFLEYSGLFAAGCP